MNDKNNVVSGVSHPDEGVVSVGLLGQKGFHVTGIVSASDVSLPRDPVENMHAATKHYVDRQIDSVTTEVHLIGLGTAAKCDFETVISGSQTELPTSYAVKEYVDRQVINISGITFPPDNGKVYAMRRQAGATEVEYVEVSGSSTGDGFPVGTVMLQPFTDAKHIDHGDEWWQCDGAVFDMLDYPEMQNALKITPYYENLLTRMTSDNEPEGHLASASHTYQSQAIAYRAFDYK